MAVKAAQPKSVDLVLSGGGVKFIGLVGAIVALMDAGYSIKRISGVSAGSVVAAILAAGSRGGQLSSADMKELAFSVPLNQWRDAGPVPFSVPRGDWCGTRACTAAMLPTTGFGAS